MGYHHDVFVSFRGRDVRYKFVDHLFAALRRKNVKAFRDTTDLGRGVDIEEGIRWAIERSRLYVVVLSPNYASSPWCLDELVRMMKCASRGGKKKTVFPIFYHVSPEDLFDCYMDDVDRHRMKYSHERVNGWIQALDRVASIAGWVVTSDRSEASLVERIARTLQWKLRDVCNRIGWSNHKNHEQFVSGINDLETVKNLAIETVKLCFEDHMFMF